MVHAYNDAPCEYSRVCVCMYVCVQCVSGGNITKVDQVTSSCSFPHPEARPAPGTGGFVLVDMELFRWKLGKTVNKLNLSRDNVDTAHRIRAHTESLSVIVFQSRWTLGWVV